MNVIQKAIDSHCDVSRFCRKECVKNVGYLDIQAENASGLGKIEDKFDD